MSDQISPVLIAAQVIDALIFDGRQYDAGADIELPAADFDKLVTSGVVKARRGKADVVPAADKQTPDELANLVKDAIAGLEASDFDGDGTPKLAAVQKAVPPGTKGVTKALVASVFASLKQTP